MTSNQNNNNIKERNSLTIEQRIAQKEAEIAKLKQQSRKLENAQKIIVGGMMINLAKDNPKTAKFLLDRLKQNVTREADLKRLNSLFEQLETLASKIPNEPPYHAPQAEYEQHNGQ